MCPEDGQGRVDGRISVVQGVVRTVQGVVWRAWKELKAPKPWCDRAKTRISDRQKLFGGRYWVSEASPKLEKSGPPRSGKALRFEKRSPRKGCW